MPRGTSPCERGGGRLLQLVLVPGRGSLIEYRPPRPYPHLPTTGQGHERAVLQVIRVTTASGLRALAACARAAADLHTNSHFILYTDNPGWTDSVRDQIAELLERDKGIQMSCVPIVQRSPSATAHQPSALRCSSPQNSNSSLSQLRCVGYGRASRSRTHGNLQTLLGVKCNSKSILNSGGLTISSQRGSGVLNSSLDSFTLEPWLGLAINLSFSCDLQLAAFNSLQSSCQTSVLERQCPVSIC